MKPVILSLPTVLLLVLTAGLAKHLPAPAYPLAPPATPVDLAALRHDLQARADLIAGLAAENHHVVPRGFSASP